MDSQAKGDAEENRLAEKLSDLEQKMKQLQQCLMDEKLKLNRERLGEGDELPVNWASMNRLHLPQCPLAKVAHSPGMRVQACPVHGNTMNGSIPQAISLPQNLGKADNSIFTDSDRYSKMISEAEKYVRVDNINEKFHQLYESSMFSPTFYRPRNSMEVLENDLERRLIRYARDYSSDDLSSKTFGNKKNFDSFENICLTRNNSTTASSGTSPSGTRIHHSSNKNKESTVHSEEDGSVDAFNPFGAIVSVRNKFKDIENFIQEASHKTMLKEAS